MDMNEVRQAIATARAELQQADYIARDLLVLLAGRLRHAGDDYRSIRALKALKRELRDFNITTGQWKGE